MTPANPSSLSLWSRGRAYRSRLRAHEERPLNVAIYRASAISPRAGPSTIAGTHRPGLRQDLLPSPQSTRGREKEELRIVVERNGGRKRGLRRAILGPTSARKRSCARAWFPPERVRAIESRRTADRRDILRCVDFGPANVKRMHPVVAERRGSRRESRRGAPLPSRSPRIHPDERRHSQSEKAPFTYSECSVPFVHKSPKGSVFNFIIFFIKAHL